MMTTLTGAFRPIRSERLFTVEEYLRMVEVGILTENDKVELLGGRIIEKMSRNPPHDSALNRLLNALVRTVPQDFVLRSQSALRLASSVPEPDVALLYGPADRYDAKHPGASDALLVVEVSDTTLATDQGEKLIFYAQASIPLYWILNLVDRRLEVYSDPTGPDHSPDYRIRHDLPESAVANLQLPGLSLAFPVREMLPRKDS